MSAHDFVNAGDNPLRYVEYHRRLKSQNLLQGWFAQFIQMRTARNQRIHISVYLNSSMMAMRPLKPVNAQRLHPLCLNICTASD